MSDVKRTVLWSAEAVQANNTSITLNDSIDNYDEIIYYGSGTRTYCPCVMTEYPVIKGELNLGGPFFFGNWGATDTYALCNGTQMFLSGTSGFVASSYFWGKGNNTTSYVASLVNNRANDVRPYMIVGVKYPDNYDRSLIWSSDHTAQLYNTTIALDETVNHFDEIMVLGSGFENGGVGCRHASKNIYNTQNKVMGCDAWAYTPWKLAEKHNLVIGQEMRLSGNSGYIGSGYFLGMGNQTTAYAAGKWNADYQFSATAPYAIYGLKRRPTYEFKSIPTDGGTVSSDINPGYSGDIAIITVIPNCAEWRQSALNISGAELTGNEFKYGNSNVSAEALFEHSKNLTLVPNEHATLSADKMSGFSGDVVTVDAITDEGWYFTGLNVTGAVATGNKFMFIGENVTAEGLYTDEGYPITYENDGNGTLTGDTDIGIPGQPVNLTAAYNTYYRLSGYDVTGGYIQDGKLYATAECTAKAVYKVNAFTATGTFEKGSNITAIAPNYGTVNKYAILGSYTGDVPNEWHATSNRWKITTVPSAYSITLNNKLSIQHVHKRKSYRIYYTAYGLIGNTINQQVTASRYNIVGTETWNYNKSLTTSITGVYHSISAKFGGAKENGWADTAQNQAIYLANNTNGTWTATGIAP